MSDNENEIHTQIPTHIHTNTQLTLKWIMNLEYQRIIRPIFQ